MPDFDFWRSGALLALNTFAAHLLTALSLPLPFLAASLVTARPSSGDSGSQRPPAKLPHAALRRPCAMPSQAPSSCIRGAEPGHSQVTGSFAGCCGCTSHAAHVEASRLAGSSPQAGRPAVHAAAEAVAQAALAFGLLRAFTAGAAMLSASIQRRHLMVWALFAPKYVFEAAFLLVSDAALAVAALACWRLA